MCFFYLVNNLQAAHIIQVCKNKNYSKKKKKITKKSQNLLKGKRLVLASSKILIV